MKIKVDFDSRKADGQISCDGGLSGELAPLVAAYAWKPKKADAVMNFIAELSKCEQECAVECDDANVKCVALEGKGRGIVMVANLADAAQPFKLECRGMKVKAVRMIDGNRTDVVVPMLASLPPLSILLVECGEERT